MSAATALSFFLPCVPPTATHHHKRIVRVGAFSRLADKPELIEARQFLEALLERYQPAEPLRGAVTLELAFTWPWLKGHSAKVRAGGRIPKVSKPDCSNLAKTLEDRLAALRFIEDDANVTNLHVSKWHGDRPGIEVLIHPTAGWQLKVPDWPAHDLFQEQTR